jgi:hypothetical protein
MNLVLSRAADTGLAFLIDAAGHEVAERDTPSTLTGTTGHDNLAKRASIFSVAKQWVKIMEKWGSRVWTFIHCIGVDLAWKCGPKVRRLPTATPKCNEGKTRDGQRLMLENSSSPALSMVRRPGSASLVWRALAFRRSSVLEVDRPRAWPDGAGFSVRHHTGMWLSQPCFVSCQSWAVRMS